MRPGRDIHQVQRDLGREQGSEHPGKRCHLLLLGRHRGMDLRGDFRRRRGAHQELSQVWFQHHRNRRSDRS